MKILSFLHVKTMADVDGTQYYRQVAPLKALHDAVEDIEVTCLTQGHLEQLEEDHGPQAVEQVLSGFDIYAYPRMVSEDCDAFIDKVHSTGGVVVIDSDDDLTEDFKLVSGYGQHFKKVLGQVDYVTVSTQPLADHFSQYTKLAPAVLLNCVNVDWMQTVASNAKRLVEDITIGFSGSPTHWGDWYKPAVPFQRICRDFPVQAILHGETPRYLKYCQEGAMQIGGVPFANYPVILRQFDILLCAVDAGDPFNAGKSAVKALEAMAVGVVPICSQFAPYQALEALGAPIVVIEEDSRDGWYEAMSSLLDQPERMRSLQLAGPDWVRAHRDVGTGYIAWERFYREIIDAQSGVLG